MFTLKVIRTAAVISFLLYAKFSFGLVIHAAGYELSNTLEANGRITGLFVDNGGAINYSLSSFLNPGQEGIYRITSDGTSQKWSSADGFDASAANDNTVLLVGRSRTTNVIRVEPDGSFGEIVPQSSGIQWLYTTLHPDKRSAYVSTFNALYNLDAVTGSLTRVATPGLTNFLDGAFDSTGVFSFGARNSATNDVGIYQLTASGLQLFASPGASPFGLTAAPDRGFWFVTALSAVQALYYVDSLGRTSLVASDLPGADAYVAYDGLTGKLYTGAQDASGTISAFSTPFGAVAVSEPPTVTILVLALIGVASYRALQPKPGSQKHHRICDIGV